MSDLAAFLLARIAEDEAVAQGEREWMRERYPDEVARIGDNNKVGLQVDKDGWVNISDGRVLAECDAKRRIVKLMLDGYSENDVEYWALDDALRLLALPFADHPDYNQSWRP